MPDLFQQIPDDIHAWDELIEFAEKYLKLRSEGAPERAVLQRLWGNASLAYPTGFQPLDDLLGGGLQRAWY
jgi:hypothetical protein